MQLAADDAVALVAANKPVLKEKTSVKKQAGQDDGHADNTSDNTTDGKAQ